MIDNKNKGQRLRMTALKKVRITQKLRLRQVAEKLNVTPQTVWKHENYGIKTPRIAQRYAKVLNCNWLDIIEL